MLLLSFNSFAQNSNSAYEFNYAIQLNECLLDGTVTGNNEIITKGVEFEISRIESNGDLIINILNFKGVAKTVGLNAKYVYDTNGAQKYFKLSKSIFDDENQVSELLPRNSFTFGALTVPIKLRFGSGKDKDPRRYFDFTSDVNIGVSAGHKFRPYRNENFAVNFLFGFSVTSVEVDQETTGDFVTTNTKAAAFTPNASIVFETKDFQIGAFIGVDILSGELGSNWLYQKKPWIGIGLGYGIFSKDKKANSQKGQ